MALPLLPCAAKRPTETATSSRPLPTGRWRLFPIPLGPPRPDFAWAQVAHGRRALARLSANFYKRPAERLRSTGITGTNGKTTTAFILEAILDAAGRKSALVGTVEYHLPGKMLPAPHTTPEPLELMQVLSQALAAGATEAVMEVSSHALEQQRVFRRSLRRRRLFQSHSRSSRLSRYLRKLFRTPSGFSSKAVEPSRRAAPS